eukprot:gene26889-5495_t
MFGPALARPMPPHLPATVRGCARGCPRAARHGAASPARIP